MSREIPISRQVIAAADALARGQLVAFPTDTVFGLACRADEHVARTRFYAAKRRPPGQPAILMVADIASVERWVQMPDRARELAARYWPGPLTLVLEATDEAVVKLGNLVSRGTLAVRVPAHETALELLRKAGLPLCTSSANRAGEPTPASAAEVRAIFGNEVALVVEGQAAAGTPSSLLDLSRGEPRLVREGAIPAADLLGEA
ncbi:MAG: L-threonylcarbamoyladenylate synthase [Candidatus Dormibacteria bacterium]